MFVIIFIFRFPFILNRGYLLRIFFPIYRWFLRRNKRGINILCNTLDSYALLLYTDRESVSLSSTLTLLTNHFTNNEIINHFDRISVTYSSLQTSILKHIIYAYAPSSLTDPFAKLSVNRTSCQRVLVFTVWNCGNVRIFSHNLNTKNTRYKMHLSGLRYRNSLWHVNS